MPVPKLRFKDGNGQNYPDLNKTIVGKICSVSTGKGNTQDKEDNGKYPFFVRSPIIEHSNTYLFDEEAVITVGDGVGTGKVFHYIVGKYNLHQRCYRMYDFKGVSGKFFYYLFSRNFYRRAMSMTAKTSVDSVRMNMITDMPISIPSLPEQEKIADFLSTYDRMIDVQFQRVEAMKTRKKGLLQKIFSQEIRFKDDQGQNYPEWKKERLEKITEKVKRKAPLNSEAPVMMISADSGFIYQKDRYSRNNAGTSLKNYTLLEQGEFAYNHGYSKTRTYGSVFWMKLPEARVPYVYHSFKLKEGCIPFWGYYLNSGLLDRSLKRLVTSSARMDGLLNISYESYMSINVNVPSLSEQQKIADFLTAVDTQIEVEEKRLKTMKTIKKGLLQQMFI